MKFWNLAIFGCSFLFFMQSVKGRSDFNYQWLQCFPDEFLDTEISHVRSQIFEVLPEFP
jgi:hypothetical protein